jgi:hypothetical protein
MSQYEFEKGDKVRCLESSHCKAFIKGNVYTVIRDQCTGVVSIKMDSLGSDTNGWAALNFELVEEPSYKFKVGDKIRCIDKYSAIGLVEREIYTFKEWHEEGVYLRVEELIKNFPTHDLRTERFELVAVPQDIQDLVDELKATGAKFVCVTGKSRSGKDTFVNYLGGTGSNVPHYRFGDTMKDLAHHKFKALGFPTCYELNSWTKEQREEPKFNGLNAIEVLIKCIDPLRLADPYVFIRPQLEVMLSGMGTTDTVVVSGCRTEKGLEVMEALGAVFVRVERPNQEVCASATMDDIQVQWPVHHVVNNDQGLEQLRASAEQLHEVLRASKGRLTRSTER